MFIDYNPVMLTIIIIMIIIIIVNMALAAIC
jgi:hypothetical protein